MESSEKETSEDSSCYEETNFIEELEKEKQFWENYFINNYAYILRYIQNIKVSIFLFWIKIAWILLKYYYVIIINLNLDSLYVIILSHII